MTFLEYLANIEIFTIFYTEHEHHFELVWSPWFLLRCRIIVSTVTVPELNDTNNDLVILLLLAIENKNLLEGTLRKRRWRQLIDRGNLVTEQRLLAYEGVACGYLNTDTTYIDGVAYFTKLLKKGVSFFKPDDEA